MIAHPDKLYRLRPPRSPDICTLAELATFLFHDYEDNQPDSALCPESKWYCQNHRCDVRTVQVKRKSNGGRPPRRKAMRCPACGQAMEFLCFVRTQTLEPANFNPGKEGNEP
jgi:hypothetical protein